jgi:hypothetical protein
MKMKIMIVMRKQIVSKEDVQLLLYLNIEKQLPSDLAEAGQVEWLVETNLGTPLSQQATSSILVWVVAPFQFSGLGGAIERGSGAFSHREKKLTGPRAVVYLETRSR